MKMKLKSGNRAVKTDIRVRLNRSTIGEVNE